jgi:parallel beta-helix repeat protein
MSHQYFSGRARSRLIRTTSPAVVSTVGAALLLLSTACGESTAPVAALRPSAAAVTGLITVAPSGLATAAGTLKAPMTIEQAVATAPAGSTIQLLSGTYQTGDLVVSRPITIRPAPGANVKLTGSVQLAATEWQAAGNAWRTPWSTAGIPSKAGAAAGAASASSAAVAVEPRTTPAAAQAVSDARAILTRSLGGASEVAAHQHMAYVDGQALTRVSTLGKVAPGKFFVDPVGKWLYVGQNPSGHTVEASAASVGMLLYTSNVRVTGVSLQHYSQIGLRIQGTNVEVDHSTFAYNGLIGLDVNAAQSAHLHDNIVRFNGQVGITANDARDVLVEHNNISNNNTGHYSVIAQAGGIKVTGMTNFTFRGNWVADNAATAVWVDVASVNSVIVDNQVLRSAVFGIYVECSNGAIIAGNVVHDNTEGIGVHFSGNVKVYNNTMVNNGRDLDASASYARAPYDLTNAVIVNNIMWDAKTSMVENLYRYNGCGKATYAEVDYNAYYRPAGSVAKTEVNYCNDFYKSMTAFHAGTGYEAHGIEIDGGGDPFFQNMWGANYHLRAGSRAINAGQPLPASIAAALGWRAGVRVSMGALQNPT